MGNSEKTGAIQKKTAVFLGRTPTWKVQRVFVRESNAGSSDSRCRLAKTSYTRKMNSLAKAR
jgi:hypothetical protein